MKAIKSILIAAILMSVSIVSFAQEAEQPSQTYEFQVAKGDSVMIKREVTRYLTGQRPSGWVWDRLFIVGQLGTKRHPNGVLLMPILSWVAETDLINVNGRAEEAREQARKEQAEERAAFEQAIGKSFEEKLAAAEAERARQDSIAAIEKARQDSLAAIERARLDSIAAVERALMDSIAAVERALQDSLAAAERARLDSLAAAHRALLDSLAAAERARLDSMATAAALEKAKKDSTDAAKRANRGYNRVTLGLRGGASSLLHDIENGKWICGGDGLFDLQYAHYWKKENRPVDLGLIIGVGIGYSQSGMKAAVNDESTYYDDSDPTFPMNIDYTIRADEVKESDGQLQLEVPIMFSLISQKGFFFNLGPKFMLPLYTPYTQTISDNENTYISAYFREIGVPVTNEVITGVLAEDQYLTKNTDNGNQFTINVMLGAELGWEWILKSGNSFGLGVFANYGLYNSFKNNTDNIPLIEVTPPHDEEIAIVDVHSATKTYAKGLGFFDAGLKLAYHFNIPKKKK